MTLNDNPRVDDERRYKLLRHRREWLRRAAPRSYVPKDVDYQKYGWDYNRAAWAVHTYRVKQLETRIETELASVKRVLKAFGWKE